MPELSESQKKAFDFAQELTKQVITLSTAVITVTISFFKDIFGATVPSLAKILLACGWGVFTLSIVFGVMTLMGMTGSLATGISSIHGTNARLPAILQHSLFVIALTLTVIAAVVAL